MTAPITPDASSSAADERAAARDRDAALVERVREGDATAFDALVQAYMRQAFQLAYRVVGHREDAEDLVQEAFLAKLYAAAGAAVEVEDLRLDEILVAFVGSGGRNDEPVAAGPRTGPRHHARTHAPLAFPG